MSYQNNKRTKKAIDSRLHDLLVIESNQGTDSTKAEKKLARFEKDLLIKEIRDFDEQYYQDVFNLDEE